MDTFLVVENKRHRGFLNFNIKFTKFKTLLNHQKSAGDKCFKDFFLTKIYPQKILLLIFGRKNFSPPSEIKRSFGYI